MIVAALQVRNIFVADEQERLKKDTTSSRFENG